jgi:hypothetical protein
VIGGLVFLALAGAQGAPDLVRVPSLDSTRGLASFKIPDEIAPAMFPYMHCLLARNGAPLHDAQGRLLAPPTGQAADCASVRSRSAAHADRMLRQQGVSDRRARADRIETVLTGIERFTGFTAMPAPQTTPAPDRERPQE